MWETDRMGNYVFVSDKVTPFIGYQPSEMIGKQLSEYIHDEDRELFKLMLAKSTRAKYAMVDFELRKRTKSGSVVYCLTSAVALYNSNEITGFFGVDKDISMRKVYETELKSAISRAEGLNSAKSEFLATMSHELRTPLNAIMGVSKALHRYGAENLTEKQKEGLQVIHQGGKRLLEQINSILDLSKVESGRMDVHYENINLADLITTLTQLVNGLLSSKPVEFIVENDIPNDVKITTDKDKLHKILVNLLGNAVKFTHSGEITLTCFMAGDEMVFTITDTGEGISQHELDHIFDKYMQASTYKSKWLERGTGLGLAICKEFVTLLEGTISVQSELGIGASFTVQLPIQQLQQGSM
jgi:PAS domain S-box-containing protein